MNYNLVLKLVIVIVVVTVGIDVATCQVCTCPTISLNKIAYPDGSIYQMGPLFGHWEKGPFNEAEGGVNIGDTVWFRFNVSNMCDKAVIYIKYYGYPGVSNTGFLHLYGNPNDVETTFVVPPNNGYADVPLTITAPLPHYSNQGGEAWIGSHPACWDGYGTRNLAIPDGLCKWRCDQVAVNLPSIWTFQGQRTTQYTTYRVIQPQPQVTQWKIKFTSGGTGPAPASSSMPGQVYKCPKCGQTFNNLAAYQQHIAQC